MLSVFFRLINKLSSVLNTSALLVFTFIINANYVAAAEDKVDYAKVAFKYLSKKEYDSAMSIAEASDNKALKKIILCERFKDKNNNKNNFQEIINFINQNPNWPYKDKMMISAEKSINENTDLAKVYEWFSKTQPMTANGYKYYLLSLQKFSKDKQKFDEIVEEAWINSNFCDSEQEKFFNKYGNKISLESHRKKIQNLVHNNNLEKAESLIRLIGNIKAKNDISLQISMIKNKDNADSILRNCIKNKTINEDIALTFLQIKRKSKSEINPVIKNLLLKYKGDQHFEKKWWDVRSYFARELTSKGSYTDAISVLNQMNFKDPTIGYQCNFLLGLFNFKKHNYKSAIEHFKNSLNIAQRPVTKARANYWIGLSYKKNKDKKSSLSYFENAATYNYVFYGQLASIELGKKTLDLKSETTSQNEIDRVKNLEAIKVIKLVSRYGDAYTAGEYAAKLVESLDDKKSIAAVIKHIDTFNNDYVTGWAIRSAINKFVFMTEGYKHSYKIENPLIEIPLTYSIIRQESTFANSAYSGVDDRGLMQIGIAAAHDSAQGLGIKHIPDKLWDPHYNILIGSKHLLDRIISFSGSYILGIPAYNCGTGNMNKAIKFFGDPRKINDLHKRVEWMEEIPIQISRNYLQNVLENLQIYRMLINKDNRLLLDEDIKR